jgi:hypothetical protein
MPSDALNFAGECFLPSEHGLISLERLHRDALAQQYVVSKQILDVAYAKGYGLALLAQGTPSAWGVNIVQEGIEHAVLTYDSSTLSFEEDSVIALRFDDIPFDLAHQPYRANASRGTNA